MDLTFEPLAEDADGLATWLSTEEWPFHGNPQPTASEVAAMIEGGAFRSPDNAAFWIREGEERIGLLVIRELDDPTPIFDLRVRATARGRGVGRQALRWLAEHVFTATRRTRIEGYTRADNLAMRRLFRACGWVKEAHHRQAWPDAQGRQHDTVGYALLRSDWENDTSTPVAWNDE